MKKFYVNPEMEVIKMETMSVLAKSLPESEGDAYTNSDGEYSNSLAGEFFGGGDSEDW